MSRYHLLCVLFGLVVALIYVHIDVNAEVVGVTTIGIVNNGTVSNTTIPTHTEEEKEREEREHIEEHPFLEFQGLSDGVWAKFFIIAVASSRLAFFAPKIGLPLITGYMFIGVLCGPFVMELLSRGPPNELLELQYVTQFALAFISFSAGSELYLPELRSLFKRIAYMSLMLATITMIFCMFFIYAIGTGGLIQWYQDKLPDNSCRMSVSALAASIMVARSPASAIAVIRELRAKGPITSTMLGVTVCGDVVVLILFTLTSSISMALCEGSGFEGAEFLITLVTLLAAVIIGYGLGYVFTFLLWIPRIPAKYTIMPLGWLTFVLADWFVLYSTNHYGVTIAFDALLICITAGYVITNKSKNRVKFLSMLGDCGPYIFIPFFTKVGLDLNLKVLLQSLPFGIVVFFMRAICVFLGAYSGGTIVGMPRFEKLVIWTTMLAQAGVSLGLASEVAVKFPTFGPDFQTTVISVILINQLVGPVACKWGLRKAGEAGKMTEDDMHDEHGEKPIKRALIVGITSSTLAVTQRLLARDWNVILYDTNQELLTMATHHLNAPADDSSHDPHAPSKPTTSPSAEESETRTEEEELERQLDAEIEEQPQTKIQVDVDGRASRISTQLVSTGGDDDDSTYASRIESLTAHLAEGSTVKAAVVDLDNDTDVYDIASYFTDRLHVPNVVAHIKNPTWGAALSHHGVIPIFDTSLMAHVLLQTMISKSLPISLTPPATSKTQSIADSLNSIIAPVDDWLFTLQTMAQEQRDEYEQLYPDSGPILSLREARAAPRDLRERLTDVRIGAHVSEALKQKYLDQLHAAHSLEDAHRVDENDSKSQEIAFLTPSQFSQRDEEMRLKSKTQQSESDTY